MSTLNIGDKVVILSDALVGENETVVERFGVKSAIGYIREITAVYESTHNKIIQVSMPTKCRYNGECWGYRPDQVLKVKGLGKVKK